MSYSNETETLKLPQYVAEDKPTWLVDMNESFAKIDVFAKNTNEEIENINTHEQETANTLESIARTLETQSDTNTDIEKRVTKNTEDLTLLTTHVNEHDNNLKYVESEINGLSIDVENKAEKTEVKTLQENLTNANNAINKLDEELDITNQKASDNEKNIEDNSIRLTVLENYGVFMGNTIKAFSNSNCSGDINARKFKLSEKVFLIDFKVSLTSIVATLSASGPSVDLKLKDFGFDENFVAKLESGCSLSSYYPILVNSNSYCLVGGMVSTDTSTKDLYFRFLPHTNTKGAISSNNKSELFGQLILTIE